MNREIKFRGILYDSKKWVYGDLIQTQTKAKYILPIEDEDLTSVIEVIPETVGQYIGLNDKEGNPIYEGDLLKRTQQINGNFVDKIYERFEVAYNSSIASFEYKPIDDRHCKQYTIRPFGGEEIEIIGNINDNKNLIPQT